MATRCVVWLPWLGLGFDISSLWFYVVSGLRQCFHSDTLFSVRNVLVGSHPLTWTAPEAPGGLATSVPPPCSPLPLWPHVLQQCLHVTPLPGTSHVHLLQGKPSFPRGCASLSSRVGRPGTPPVISPRRVLCWVPCVRLSSRKCLVLL